MSIQQIHSQKWLTAAIFCWLTLLPLVFWSRAEVPFEIPRVRFVQLSAIVFWIITLTVPSLKLSIRSYFPVVCFVAWNVISSLLGIDIHKSIFGNYYRLDGLLTLISLVLIGLVIPALIKNNTAVKISFAIHLGALLSSVLALQQFFTGTFLATTGVVWADQAVGATFGQPNFLAGYLAVSLPFSLYVLSQSQGIVIKLFYLVSICLGVLAVVVSQSLGGLLALGLGLILWLSRNFSRKIKLVLVLLSLILVSIGVWQYYLSQVVEVYPDSRVRLIRQLSTAVGYRPLLGWGVANVDYAFDSNSWPIKFDQDIYVDKAHSVLLETLVTTGIIGFGFYLSMLIITTHNLYQKSLRSSWYQILLIALLVYMFHSQTNVISIGEEVIFWFIIGMSLSPTLFLTSGIHTA